MDKLAVGDKVTLEFGGRSEHSTTYHQAVVIKVTPTGRVTVRWTHGTDFTDFTFDADGDQRGGNTYSRRRIVPAAEWPRIIARREKAARDNALDLRVRALSERFRAVRGVSWATEIVSVRNDLNDLIADMEVEGHVPESGCALPPGHDGRRCYG